MPVTSEVLRHLLLSGPDRLLVTEEVSACALLSQSLPLASPLYNLSFKDSRGVFPGGEKALHFLMLCWNTLYTTSLAIQKTRLIHNQLFFVLRATGWDLLLEVSHDYLCKEQSSLLSAIQCMSLEGRSVFLVDIHHWVNKTKFCVISLQLLCPFDNKQVFVSCWRHQNQGV